LPPRKKKPAAHALAVGDVLPSAKQ